jgi:hypothetical protein
MTIDLKALPNHLWGAEALPIADISEVGTFKRFRRGRHNEMLPIIYFKASNSNKLKHRKLTDVEMAQFWENDVWHNEMLFDVSYSINEGTATHTRLEVANRYNNIPNPLLTIH